jgi:radical SAM/Cys-rich protein
MIVLWENKDIRKTTVEIVQINLGSRCNQRCSHCHIGASPDGNKNMDEKTASLILKKLIEISPQMVEFTGGAPEMNPNLQMFIEELSKNRIKTAVRTNLTALELDGYSSLIDLYARYNVKVIASLPGCFKDVTDKQRGNGVFDGSIAVLKKLNKAGYGADRLQLDIVYNPAGDCLPPPVNQLEYDYRQVLGKEHGIIFNRLITIVNSPIGGFKKYLINNNKYEDYLRLLVNNFNAETLNHIMCRKLLSVDYLGHIYDCDFNLALGIKINGYENKKFWEIDFDDFNPEITCGEHCYACTAASGSSCHGALLKDNKDFNPVDVVQKYYGSELKSTSDLKISACCMPDLYPPHIREALFYVADEIKHKYYGCGSPIPLVLKGLKALDLGCGTGRDCYLLSKLVGENGFVYGIDMTENQIEIAVKYIDEQTKRFGYKKPNVRFIHDYIENTGRHIPENSLDIVISNCVINLIEDKEGVIKQIYRILKNRGEFYFSDIYADRRLPNELRTNSLLYGECLGGALYWKDFERIAKRVGFADPRIISKRVIEIKNEEIQGLVGNVTFYSITYRLWKINELEDACEDYGHIAIYRGGIPESPFKFMLDATHIFEKDKPERVCGNTALMLSETRFREHFEVIGSFETHFGLFANCGSTILTGEENRNSEGCSC